jgi:hypothetical protein
MRERERERVNDFDFKIYKKNIFSQFGEDGIIEEIFKRLKDVSDKQCCEFGAWDGKLFSNTCNLITNYNYEAILIEPDKKKFLKLNINFSEKKIKKINEFVEFSGKNSLDNILQNNNFNKDFDFLSIDIDGCDYYIFESLVKFAPKLICIEFNPTIPSSVNFIQEKNMKVNQGSSALSLISLALSKNYFPVASTDCNLFFIHNKFKKFITKKDKFNIDELQSNSNANFIFFGYDGTIFTSVKPRLIWHKLEIKKLSYLPNFLMKYPHNFNLFEKLLFKFYKFYKDPLKYLKKLHYKLFK